MAPALFACQVIPEWRTSLKIKNWSHVGIVVDDLEMMTDFYVNTIGLERLHEIDARPQPDGDHTGVPNVHRTLRFVGIPGDTSSVSRSWRGGPRL